MSLGLRDYKARRRRAFRWKAFKVFLVVAGLLAAGLFAYEGGSVLARQEVFALEKRVIELEGMLAELQERNAKLAAEVDTAKQHQDEWQSRYEAEVPQGESRELFELVHDQLSSGVAADRLAFVIGAARNRQVCDGPTQTKRFFVKTPLYEGANDSVSFDRGTLTITAHGETASDESGNREAWFDPAAPVTVAFARIGGTMEEKTGLLPIHHAMVHEGSEYRFTIQAGPQGFVNVTGNRCKFP